MAVALGISSSSIVRLSLLDTFNTTEVVSEIIFEASAPFKCTASPLEVSLRSENATEVGRNGR